MFGGASGGPTITAVPNFVYSPPSSEQAPVRFTLRRFIRTVDRAGDFKRVIKLR